MHEKNFFRLREAIRSVDIMHRIRYAAKTHFLANFHSKFILFFIFYNVKLTLVIFLCMVGY